MTPSDIRKKAEETRTLLGIHKNCEGSCDVISAIEKALLETYSVGKDDGEQAGFERGAKACAENLRNNILSLLQKDKKAIGEEK